MASSITGAFSSFWHAMTSNDRHATHNSPYRTGQHVPLSQSNKHTPLTSVATSAMESRTDLNSGYPQDSDAYSSNMPVSPQMPYSPGMRSTLQRQGSNQDTSYSASAMGTGDVPMQSFNEGLPPPPPVSHSWKRIDRWTEDNYEELYENLGEGCTQNDVNELEHELDCTLPQEVRDSLQIHDGQERGGRPSGIVFGCMLLDCEEIVQEWVQWRRVNEEYLRGGNQHSYAPQQLPKAFAGASSSSAQSGTPTQSGTNPHWREDLLALQDSQPPNAIHKAYVHPAWIPMARDWGGNNICVDLAPGPTGKWGQVILMGRDYDCKYVVSRSWAAFLATLADDMSTDKWFIDDETHELKLREFKQPGVEPAYMDILRWRADQKYGRKATKRRPGAPLKINSNVKAEYGNLNGFSPYDDGRPRSPQRFPVNGKAPVNSSPRAHLSSPLARVTEEVPATGDMPDVDLNRSAAKLTKLVSIDSPVIGQSTEGLLHERANGEQALRQIAEADAMTGAQELKNVAI